MAFEIRTLSSRTISCAAVLMAVSSGAGCGGADPQGEELGETYEALSTPQTIPTRATFLGTDAQDNELGAMESEEHQGLAACPRYWLWTSKTKIMRVPRNDRSMYEPLQGVVEELPEPFKSLGYDHYGDGECAGDHFIVAITAPPEKGWDPVVLEFNEELELLSFARTSGAVAAVNPVDGMLYGQVSTNLPGQVPKSLAVYNRSMMRKFRWEPDECNLDCWKKSEYAEARLEEMRRIKLVPFDRDDAWWEGAIHQGGSFSSNGVFYMTVDHLGGPFALTGVHAFEVNAFSSDDARDIPIPGVGSESHIQVSYSGSIVVTHPLAPFKWETKEFRNYELEGNTVYFYPGERQHHLNVSLLHNELDDDDVSVYHYGVDEAPRAAINDYWMKQAALW